MPRLLTLLCAAACALPLAACGDDKGSDVGKAAATPEATQTATATATPAAAECQKVKAPKPKPEGKLAKPKLKLDGAKTYVATVATSCGDFEITLDAKRAPKTGGSFVSLARRKFFDKTTFHRIVPGFVIQGGDPQGTGMGGPGYSVEETPPSDLAYEKGVVAMAKTGAEPPGTSGSQFFVVTGDSTPLPPEYALLGKVTKGQEVVDLIGAVQTTPDERPVDPVVIESVTIRES
ncbi:MAG TPA: peptidylprolyl isomerase [Solirubrobacteraceae bacterium]|jgi:peptidyl-prolyl cis-trans isomerase B (cyclophilin B)